MQFTPGQLRETLGLTQDTYRHWKNVLTPLSGRNGYRPCFSTGDLVATAIVQTLVEDCGIQISIVALGAGDLFRICERQSWAVLERSTLVFEPRDRRFTLIEGDRVHQRRALAVIVPLARIVERLRTTLLGNQSVSEQADLRFPPSVVSRGQSSGGSR